MSFALSAPILLHRAFKTRETSALPFSEILSVPNRAAPATPFAPWRLPPTS